MKDYNMQTDYYSTWISQWLKFQTGEEEHAKWKVIYDALRDLVPFLYFKKREKHP